MNIHDLTVIIPTRNRPAGILEALRYLVDTLHMVCPIVVIDQGDPGNRCGEPIASLGRANIRYQVQEKVGTGFARNQGGLLAHTAWLVFLDDDVRPASGYFETLLGVIHDQPWVDAITGGIAYGRDWEAYCQDQAGWLEVRRSKDIPRRQRSLTRDAAQWFTQTPNGSYAAPAIGLSSGNLAIRREAFLGVGGFDQNIEDKGDDKEMGVRLWWYGYRVLYLPELLAFHLQVEGGGTRSLKPESGGLFKPAPSVGWIYFFLKWFPFELKHLFWSEYMRLWLKQPWTIPVRTIRFLVAVRHARERLARGEALLSKPRRRTN